ncbi:MAG: TatD family hydrolase [Coriobacteriales bacterium]|nr:TatD family hydrolase [Coriobacteriales bacterium]
MDAFRDAKGRVIEAPAPAGMIADTHCHLDMLSDPSAALALAAQHDVRFIVDVVDPSENTTALQQMDGWLATASELLAARRGGGSNDIPVSGPHLCGPSMKYRFAVGVHPHNARHYTREMERELITLAADPRVSAIGEIGLDYHYDLSPRSLQREAFARQLRLAHTMGLPVVLHIREAHDEALRILRQEGVPAAGCVLHCFNLGPAELEPFLELGCYVSLGGPITFMRSDDTREAVALIPADRLLTETDAPFMAPEPFRGMECGPAHTVFTADRLHQVYAAAHPSFGDKRLFLERLMENSMRIYDREPSAWQQDAAAQEKLAIMAQPCAELLPRVALICGSPREDGASETLSRVLMKQLHQHDVVCDSFRLSQHHIQGCDGCDACRHSGFCVKTTAGIDDFGQLEAMLDCADALIVVAPVYFAGPSSQLKAVLDRMQPYWMRRYVLGQEPRAKRPFEMFVVGGGGDPFGFDPLVTSCRSAFNCTGFGLSQVHDFVGYGQYYHGMPKSARKSREQADTAFEQQAALAIDEFVARLPEDEAAR